MMGILEGIVCGILSNNLARWFALLQKALAPYLERGSSQY